MLRAYRLLYPASPHTTPQLWEWDPQEGTCDRISFALSAWLESLYCLIKCPVVS